MAHVTGIMVALLSGMTGSAIMKYSEYEKKVRPVAYKLFEQPVKGFSFLMQKEIWILSIQKL